MSLGLRDSSVGIVMGNGKRKRKWGMQRKRRNSTVAYIVEDSEEEIGHKGKTDPYRALKNLKIFSKNSKQKKKKRKK